MTNAKAKLPQEPVRGETLPSPVPEVEAESLEPSATDGHVRVRVSCPYCRHAHAHAVHGADARKYLVPPCEAERCLRGGEPRGYWVRTRPAQPKPTANGGRPSKTEGIKVKDRGRSIDASAKVRDLAALSGEERRALLASLAAMDPEGFRTAAKDAGLLRRDRVLSRRVLQPDHPRADRHGHVLRIFLAAEAKIGRYLDKSESVHPIDGDRENLEPGNLHVLPFKGLAGLRSALVNAALENLRTGARVVWDGQEGAYGNERKADGDEGVME